MGTVNIPVTTPGSGQRLNMEQFLCWTMSAICKRLLRERGTVMFIGVQAPVEASTDTCKRHRFLRWWPVLDLAHCTGFPGNVG